MEELPPASSTVIRSAPDEYSKAWLQSTESLGQSVQGWQKWAELVGRQLVSA